MTALSTPSPITRSDWRFPPLPGDAREPVWRGDHFEIGSRQERILAYQTEATGWSDAHADFKEDLGGDDHPIDLASRQHVLDQFAKYRPCADPVTLEVGFNDGRLLETLGQAFPTARRVGADIVISLAQRNLDRLRTIPLLQFDLRRAPLPDGFADVLVLLNVLEHIDDDAQAMNEAGRLLRPGGIVLIEVPHGRSLFDFYDAYWLHHRRYDLPDLRRLVEKAGLGRRLISPASR